VVFLNRCSIVVFCLVAHVLIKAHLLAHHTMALITSSQQFYADIWPIQLTSRFIVKGISVSVKIILPYLYQTR